MVYEMDYQDYQKALQFDQRASTMEALQHLTWLLLDELDPQEGEKVLDVGAGTGRLGIAMSNSVANGFVTGIDSGYGMLRVARDKLVNHGIDNVLLVMGRAEALPILPQVFDSACLMFSFHHFSFPERAIAEIYRILKTKGHLVSVDPILKEPTDGEDERLNEIIEEAFQLAHGPDFRFFTTAELRGLFENAGFSMETCETYDFPFHHDGGIQPIPMGSHWLQAYELLRFRQEDKLIRRFEENYLVFREKDRKLQVKGKLSWVILKAVKV